MSAADARRNRRDPHLADRPDAGRTGTRRAALAVLAVVAACYALGVWRGQPVAARGAEAPVEVFSAARALATLKTLLGNGTPHPVGSAANAAVRARIVARLNELGLSATVQRAFACGGHGCAWVHNLVAPLPARGEGAGKDVVLLMAHYDSVAAGVGAGDDGSGVAVLLETARALRDSKHPLDRPVALLLTDGEEAGLLGAQAFVDEHPLAKRVAVVINVEARGSGGGSLMFEAVNAGKPLIEALGRASRRPLSSSLYSAVYERLPNDTDLTVFRRRGVPGFNFGFIERVEHYHTPLDDLAHLDPRSVQHQGDNVLGLVKELASSRVPIAPAPKAAWVDTLGTDLWSWPLSWTPWLALAVALLVAGAIRLVVQDYDWSWAGWLFGLVGLGLPALLLAGLFGFGVVMGWRAISPAWAPWYAHPWGGVAAVIGGAVVAVGLVARWLPDGTWPRWAAVWSLWTLATLAVALLLPEAAHLFVIPTMVAGATAWAAVWQRLRAGSGREPTPLDRAAALAPMIVAALLVLRVAHGLVHAVGLDAAPGVALLWALVLLTAAPLWSRKAGWTVPIAGACLLVAGAVAAALSPPFTESAPQRASIAHVDRAEGAEWFVDTSWGPVPAGMRGLTSWSPPGPPPVNLLGFRSVASAPAPRTEDTGPTLTLASAVPIAGGRRVEARLVSKRGAPLAALVIPPAAGVRAVRFEGHPWPGRRIGGRWWPGWTMHVFRSLPPEGARVTIELTGSSAELVVFDASYGLPPTGTKLLEGRGKLAVPSQDGDLTIRIERLEL